MQPNAKQRAGGDCVLFLGSESASRRARALLSRTDLDVLEVDLSKVPVNKRAHETPTLLTSEGTYPGLEAIQWYLRVIAPTANSGSRRLRWQIA